MLKSIDFGVNRLFCPDSGLTNSVDGRLLCRRAAMGTPSNSVASGHFAPLCRVVAEFSKSLLGFFLYLALCVGRSLWTAALWARGFRAKSAA
jgi:hypothetical protein